VSGERRVLEEWGKEMRKEEESEWEAFGDAGR
jgi:hypothetical protein